MLSSLSRLEEIKKAFSQYLPSPNDQIFLSLSHFLEIVLGISPNGSTSPEPPSENLISILIHSTTEEAVPNGSFFEIPASYTTYFGERDVIQGMHKDECPSELSNNELKIFSFNSNQKHHKMGQYITPIYYKALASCI
ncbi:hypothetical protein O181_013328 [Austropuccinia psidii MF-1]|uniref:Uncharacterized protein n=1 Tax=Austropuccinia psidii MF-1 TaxID=1389203 RepID=A0A9Q3BYH2_9BASI|nr:hypothetical protein [Austropuccinia psidii MF-1]